MTLKLLEFGLAPDTLSQGFTQSEITTLDNCGEKWYLDYNLRLKPRNHLSWPLTYGSWIHSALEEWYATKGKSWDLKIDHAPLFKLTQAQQAEWEYYEKLAHVQMEVYTSYYKGDFEMFEVYDQEWVERVVEYEFEGILLKGLVDVTLVSKKLGKLIMVDHKTTSRIDRNTLEGWDFRFQFMFYVWLIRKAFPDLKLTRIMPNAIRKPRLKQTQKETLDGLMNRIRLDMLNRPEEYFYREILPMRKDALKRFEQEILRPKLQRLQILKNGPKEAQIAIARNKNTDNCLRYGAPCPYFSICKQGEMNKLLYETRNQKHEELEIES